MRDFDFVIYLNEIRIQYETLEDLNRKLVKFAMLVALF
jgi:hypothetical protein